MLEQMILRVYLLYAEYRAAAAEGHQNVDRGPDLGLRVKSDTNTGVACRVHLLSQGPDQGELV